MKTSSRYDNFKNNQRIRSGEGDHSGNWAISYGDMITLLLTFFVLFFNINVQRASKVEFLQEDLKKDFTTTDTAKRKPSNTDANGSLELGQDQFPQIVDRRLEKLPFIDTKIEGDKLLVEFPGISFFSSGEFALTREGENVLKKFAQTFKKYTGEMRLIVRGYTDNRPVKSLSHRFYKDNLELSSLRSVAAIRALNKEEVPLELLRIGGYGETDKSAKISDADILKYDRKIVLVVEPLDSTERGHRKKKDI
ncbi:MAG: OmpA family protein [Bdellovibrionales bacterium]|nr:OmpA family protein [Bdellovibrionales bacterium]